MSYIIRYVYHFNNYCNLHCELCSDFCNIPIDENSPLIERRLKWSVSVDEIELFCSRFDGIAPEKNVHLTGGEPTAIPEDRFSDLIEVLHSYGRQLVLVTNGYNLLGIEKPTIQKIGKIKLDDHGVNHEHIVDCVKYLKTFYKGTIKPIETLVHYDLAKTRKLEINKNEHCGKETLRNKVEVIVKQGVVYPCCAMASFVLYDNTKQMENELNNSGWNLENPDIVENLKNWEVTLPRYSMDQCKDNCWWPLKRILGEVNITHKHNDVIKKKNVRKQILR